jgi:hypothetical protein
MPLFGGDPRLVTIELIMEINLWYDVLCIPILFFNQLNKLEDIGSTIVGFIQMAFETLRIFLVKSHQKSNLPNFVAYLILSFIPTLIFEFIWLVFLKNVGAFVKTIMVGLIILQLLQLILCVIPYKRLSNYLNRFYEFAKAKRDRLEVISD